MFTKKTLGGQLPEELIAKINENYFDLFATNDEITSFQIINSLINKALQKNDVSEFQSKINLIENENLDLINQNEILKQQVERYKNIFKKYINQKSNQISELEGKSLMKLIGQEMYFILLKNTQSKTIIDFYNSFKNKELIKPIDTQNELTNVVNLLKNAYLIRILKGKYQPQTTTPQQIFQVFNNSKIE